jgi:hypothetical protein
MAHQQSQYVFEEDEEDQDYIAATKRTHTGQPVEEKKEEEESQSIELTDYYATHPEALEEEKKYITGSDYNSDLLPTIPTLKEDLLQKLNLIIEEAERNQTFDTLLQKFLQLNEANIDSWLDVLATDGPQDLRVTYQDALLPPLQTAMHFAVYGNRGIRGQRARETIEMRVENAIVLQKQRFETWSDLYKDLKELDTVGTQLINKAQEEGVFTTQFEEEVVEFDALLQPYFDMNPLEYVGSRIFTNEELQEYARTWVGDSQLAKDQFNQAQLIIDHWERRDPVNDQMETRGRVEKQKKQGFLSKLFSKLSFKSKKPQQEQQDAISGGGAVKRKNEDSKESNNNKLSKTDYYEAESSQEPILIDETENESVSTSGSETEDEDEYYARMNNTNNNNKPIASNNNNNNNNSKPVTKIKKPKQPRKKGSGRKKVTIDWKRFTKDHTEDETESLIPRIESDDSADKLQRLVYYSDDEDEEKIYIEDVQNKLPLARSVT